MYYSKLKTTLEGKINKGKAFNLKGPRQVGKTTLLKNIIDIKNHLFLDGGDSTARSLLNTPNTEKIKSIIGAHRLIFIDEAQRIKGIGLTLKIIIDQDGFYFDAVYFTNVVHLYPINEMGIYAWYGKITNRFGFCSMNVLKSKKISIAGDPKH